MNIFISWSGSTSKQLASLLRSWIPDVIQSASPWMSSEDIGTGKRWSNEIQERLESTNFGILCLTKENLTAPWVLFEAGALAKSIGDAYLCPWLFNMEPHEIPGGPLTQFQSVTATKEGTWKIVDSINEALKDKALSEDKLQRSFDRCWPELERQLLDIDVNDTKKAMRSTDDMIKETLVLVRNIGKVTARFQGIEISNLGLLHDLAKFDTRFQEFLRKKIDDDDKD